MRTAFELAPGVLSDGPILTAWGQGPTLAVATSKRQIALLNQDGVEHHSFRMDAPNVKAAATTKHLIAVHSITWSSDGTTLAVLPVASDFIYLWDTLSKRAQKGLMGAHAPGQEMIVACWSHEQPHIIIGTNKGSVLLFDASSMRVIQNITALHEQAVKCGDFSGNIFCTAGEDKKVVLTYDTGEHLATVAVENAPLQALFSPTAAGNTAMSAVQLSVSDGKSLLVSSVRALRDAAGSKATVKLEFDGCGDIISHAWCGSGSVIVAFEPGILKLVSTLDSTMGQSQAHLQLSSLCTSAAFCKATSKMAATGTRGVLFPSALLHPFPISVAVVNIWCQDSCCCHFRHMHGVYMVNVGTQLTEIPSERLELLSGSVPSEVNWSPGGQLLAVGASDGTLCCALGCLPNISAAAAEQYACLSTLTEVTVYDSLGTAVATVPIKFTPHFLALSSTTLAVGMNDQVYFYDLESYAIGSAAGRGAVRAVEAGAEMRHTYDEGTAEGLAVSDSLAAALIGGRLIVHRVSEPGHEGLVPYKGQDVTSFDLSEDFLILGTAAGLIQHYSVSEGPLAPLNEYRHTRSGKKAAISALWAAPGRAHLVFVDDAPKAFLFSAVDDQVLPLQGITSIVSNVVFHSEDPNVFMVIEQERWCCFVYCPVTARGPKVQQIDTVTPPVSCQPLVLSYGFAASQLDNGQVSRYTIGAFQEHDPHDKDYNAEAHASLECGEGIIVATKHWIRMVKMVKNNDKEGETDPGRFTDLDPAVPHILTNASSFRQALKVFHITEAVAAAAKASIASLWQEVANAALHVLDLNSAIAALREAGNASMVLSLERLRYTEDRYLLAGHVLALADKDFDTAQGMFVRVNAEETALQMRKDLRHWSKATELAAKCAPQEMTALQQRHAAALELQDDVSGAHAIFQDALNSAAASDQDLIKSCKAGIARCTIRAGDARGGLQLALASGSKTAIRDCADLLATTGSLGTALEAGELYEAAGDSEQAVALYLEAKAFARAAPLMGNVKNRKLVLEFAKVREDQGQLTEASVEYERGGDAESAVRLLLQAADLSKALDIARRSCSPAAATLIVQHCLQESNWAGAVEFSILAGDYTSAWQVAQTHGEMDTYASSLGPNAPSEQHAQVAVCFQNIKEHFKAAQQFELAGNQLSAVSQYMAHAKKVSSSEGDEATKRALAIISDAQPEDGRRMARMVLSAADQTDHCRFAEKFIDLNLALGNTGAAISAAADAAVADQCRGEYKIARKKLVDAAIRFRDGNAIPPALLAPLATLHSYILVKDVLRLGNAPTAAQLLKRVAANLSSFDSTHAAQILVSAALNCAAAGFSASAFEIAGELMHAQYREALKGMSAHKRKIEALVRKTVAKEDPPQVLVSCFWCGTKGPEFELNCAACQSVIPFCSASGKRMESQSWKECQSCRFPGRAEELNLYIQQLGKCPVCEIGMSVDDLIVAGAESKHQVPKLTPLRMENRYLVNG